MCQRSVPNTEWHLPPAVWVFPPRVTRVRKFLTDMLTSRPDLRWRAFPFPSDFPVCQGDDLSNRNTAGNALAGCYWLLCVVPVPFAFSFPSYPSFLPSPFLLLSPLHFLPVLFFSYPSLPPSPGVSHLDQVYFMSGPHFRKRREEEDKGDGGPIRGPSP